MSIDTLNKVNDFKNKITFSEIVIEKEKKAISELTEEYVKFLNNTYPLISLEGQNYFFHKTKWGNIDEDATLSPLTGKSITSFDYFKAQDVVSGEVLNKQQETTIFNNESLYLQHVLYDWDDSYSTEDSKSIWEYFWVELDIN